MTFFQNLHINHFHHISYLNFTFTRPFIHFIRITNFNFSTINLLMLPPTFLPLTPPPPFHAHRLPTTTKLPTCLPTYLPTNASEEKQRKHKRPPNLNPIRQKKKLHNSSQVNPASQSHALSPSSSQLAGGSQKKNTHIDNQNSHTTIDKRKEVG
ncbi:hypothetical protein B9Z19DRAFT_652063 [Tuber borchii]|uniref:Uncharacterized protein n=1 Tax=Tuber borchii TaxID=42251 RepID=A0A2T7A8C9_TUBBO|nr:hypothetical protein B9Z19DRAFT_652063 [Tuber borchii]